MEEFVWPANVKIDPAASDSAAARHEAAGDSDQASCKGDPRSDTASDVDECAPEEAGYGYGV